MKTLLLATQNAKKGRELAELCAGRFAVKTLADVGLADITIVEDAETFAGNARIKVDTVTAALSPEQRADVHAVLGDDSGLVVDALGGKPGVRSARFADDHGTQFLGASADAANNALLLVLLDAVPHEQRRARFVAHVHARVLAGAGGFGYDPLFLPVESPGKAMAELTSDEKHAISHRGRAMREILSRL